MLGRGFLIVWSVLLFGPVFVYGAEAVVSTNMQGSPRRLTCAACDNIGQQLCDAILALNDERVKEITCQYTSFFKCVAYDRPFLCGGGQQCIKRGWRTVDCCLQVAKAGDKISLICKRIELALKTED